ncbi:MAG: uroporphyrinogen-III synthase, partial [Rhodobacteraceae bacterium]|nr:uroporphyrinogen-III synthase [Paracoccaceae bacterium]
MRVLIIQPESEIAATADAIRRAGHEPAAFPLIALQRVDDAELNLKAAQAFIVTEPAGALALADKVGVRTFPVYCDGQATAAAARAAGFKNVVAADGDATAIAKRIQTDLKPVLGALIYAASATAPINLSAMLNTMGFSVRQVALYAVRRAEALPDALAKMLTDGNIDALACLGPDEARAFTALVQKAGLEKSIGRLSAVVAAPTVAAPLTALKFARTVTASHATREDVVAAVVSLPARIAKEAEDAKARAEAEARAKAEAAAKAARESEEKARAEADEKAAREAEEKARAEAKAKAARDAEDKARAEAKAQAKAEANERTRIEAEEKARAKAEAKAARDAEDKARAEAKAQAKAEAEERARLEAEAQAKAKAEERAAREAEDKARAVAEAKARADADERARTEAAAKTAREAEDKARAEAAAKA